MEDLILDGMYFMKIMMHRFKITLCFLVYLIVVTLLSQLLRLIPIFCLFQVPSCLLEHEDKIESSDETVFNGKIRSKHKNFSFFIISYDWQKHWHWRLLCLEKHKEYNFFLYFWWRYLIFEDLAPFLYYCHNWIVYVLCGDRC